MRRRLDSIRTAAVAVAIVVMTGIGAAAVVAAPGRQVAAAKTTAAAANEKASPIDLNTADVEKLTELPGIGRSIAQRIVDYRKEHGPYKSVEELLNVRGVGEKLLDRLRDRLTTGPKG